MKPLVYLEVWIMLPATKPGAVPPRLPTPQEAPQTPATLAAENKSAGNMKDTEPFIWIANRPKPTRASAT
jgi:hypothetical protein